MDTPQSPGASAPTTASNTPAVVTPDALKTIREKLTPEDGAIYDATMLGCEARGIQTQSARQYANELGSLMLFLRANGQTLLTMTPELLSSYNQSRPAMRRNVLSAGLRVLFETEASHGLKLPEHARPPPPKRPKATRATAQAPAPQPPPGFAAPGPLDHLGVPGQPVGPERAPGQAARRAATPHRDTGLRPGAVVDAEGFEVSDEEYKFADQGQPQQAAAPAPAPQPRATYQPPPAPPRPGLPPFREEQFIATHPYILVYKIAGRTDINVAPGQKIFVGQYSTVDMSWMSPEPFIQRHIAPRFGPFPGGEDVIYRLTAIDNQGRTTNHQKDIPIAAELGAVPGQPGYGPPGYGPPGPRMPQAQPYDPRADAAVNPTLVQMYRDEVASKKREIDELRTTVTELQKQAQTNPMLLLQVFEMQRELKEKANQRPPTYVEWERQNGFGQQPQHGNPYGQPYGQPPSPYGQPPYGGDPYQPPQPHFQARRPVYQQPPEDDYFEDEPQHQAPAKAPSPLDGVVAEAIRANIQPKDSLAEIERFARMKNIIAPPVDKDDRMWSMMIDLHKQRADDAQRQMEALQRRVEENSDPFKALERLKGMRDVFVSLGMATDPNDAGGNDNSVIGLLREVVANADEVGKGIGTIVSSIAPGMKKEKMEPKQPKQQALPAGQQQKPAQKQAIPIPAEVTNALRRFAGMDTSTDDGALTALDAWWDVLRALHNNNSKLIVNGQGFSDIMWAKLQSTAMTLPLFRDYLKNLYGALKLPELANDAGVVERGARLLHKNWVHIFSQAMEQVIAPPSDYDEVWGAQAQGGATATPPAAPTAPAPAAPAPAAPAPEQSATPFVPMMTPILTEQAAAPAPATPAAPPAAEEEEEDDEEEDEEEGDEDEGEGEEDEEEEAPQAAAGGTR